MKLEMNLEKSFRPLKVTAWLRTGVVSDEFLPLDGIIYAQLCRDKFGHEEFSLPGGNQEFLFDRNEMPFEIRERAGEWYFACSFAQPEKWWLHEACDHWNKRFDLAESDLVDFKGKRGTINVQSARYRAYHMPIYYRVAIKVEWYCVGDRERIEYLLSTVTHIGKKSSQGYGRVNRWETAALLEDFSEYKDGLLMRALPTTKDELLAIGKRGAAFKVRHCGFRPSYYVKQNQTLCLIP